jgi:tight junction protein 1
MSSKKLLEQCQKLEKLWGHVLTSTLPLHADNWYNKVTDLIEKQQTAPIWMSDTKVGLFTHQLCFLFGKRFSF